MNTCPIIRDLEQHKLAASERIKELESHGRHHSAEETPPHDFCREEIRHLFQTEEYTTDGCTEGNCDTGGTRGTEDFTSLRYTKIMFVISLRLYFRICN